MDELRILMFHHITPQAESPWEVAPEQLLAAIDELTSQGFRFETLSTLTPGADRVACVTFDDAYVNVYRNAFPALVERRIPATIFVPVNYVGGVNTFDRLYQFGLPRCERIMDWLQITELARAGWSIQSHACSHLPLDVLLPGQIEDEFIRSRCVLEDRIGAAVHSIAYPFGRPPARLEMVGQCGYRMGLLADGGAVWTPLTNPFEIPRIPVLPAFAQPVLASEERLQTAGAC